MGIVLSHVERGVVELLDAETPEMTVLVGWFWALDFAQDSHANHENLLYSLAR